jgi:hypothetical protein
MIDLTAFTIGLPTASADGQAVRLRFGPPPAARVTQAHVIKHPFGMGAIHARSALQRRRWNEEGWDSLAPPVVSVEQRRATVSQILELRVDGDRCAVPKLANEELGGQPPTDAYSGATGASEPCYVCNAALSMRCCVLTKPVAAAYSSLVAARVGQLHERAVWVARDELSRRLGRCARAGERLRGLVVLTLGGERGLGARLSCWDGVRIEFYRTSSALTFRTAYRERRETPSRVVSFLWDFAPITTDAWSERMGVSDKALVPRLWWEEMSS